MGDWANYSSIVTKSLFLGGAVYLLRTLYYNGTVADSVLDNVNNPLRPWLMRNETERRESSTLQTSKHRDYSSLNPYDLEAVNSSMAYNIDLDYKRPNLPPVFQEEGIITADVGTDYEPRNLDV